MKQALRLTAFFCLVSANLLFGDLVALKNGDRVSGKIINTDDKTITVKSDLMGEVKIDKTAVVSVRSDEPLNVTLKDGKTVVGKVETVENEVRVVQDGKPLAAAPVDTVTAYRDNAAQHAWEREQERQTHARFLDFWAGTVVFGLANTSGNSSTTSFNTAAALTRAVAKNKTGLYFNQVYASQSNTPPFGATANQVNGGLRQDRDISKKMFLFGLLSFEYDQFLSLDLRSVAGGGLGYHAWKSEKGYFDVGLGGNYNREKFAGAPVRNSGEILTYEEFSYKPFTKLKLFERFAFFPNMTDTGEYRFNFIAGAAVPVFKWLDWTVGVNNSYMSNPPVGRKTNDFAFTTGIGITFDQGKR
jgi:putative salt-induced outer membrane protein